MNFLITKYKLFGKLYRKIKFALKINWVKTLYFNFKMLPFSIAKKLPVYFYGKVKFNDLSGKVEINAPIKSGMIGFGQPYEIFTKGTGRAEIFFAGNIIFNGYCQFGIDYLIYVAPNASLTMGNMSSLGSNGKIVCFDKIKFGEYCRIGFESQLIDTNAHQMIDVLTDEKFPITSSIILGDYNYFGNRVSIMQNTYTPNYCTIASNSLCNNDYVHFGTNVLIGGIPAKVIRQNISRDWEGEIENLDSCLKVFI
jgi:acetyltransferase-like isoleucine patch superfamily enzyme